MARSSRRSTVGSRGVRATLALSIALAATSLASHADAQNRGFALDRYEPTPSDLYFASEFPWYSRNATWALRGGVVFDYARHPLVLRGSDGTVRPLVSDMLVVHPQIGLAIFDRVALNLSIPIGLVQAGETASIGTNTVGAYGGPAVGDLRIGIRSRIFGQSDEDPISLHASVYTFVPGLSQREANLSDESVRVRGVVTLAGHTHSLRWSFGAGVHFRPLYETGGNSSLATEFLATGAIGIALAGDRLTIGPEAWTSVNLVRQDPYSVWSGEVLLGAHYLVADSLLVGGGIGAGLAQSPGTPQFRALLQVAYAGTPPRATHAVTHVPPPPPPDTDRDGILDRDDRCVSEPAGPHPDPERVGCPAGDRDHDGVLDPDDACVDEPRGEHPDAMRVGCPQHDSDGDGAFDAEDECVTEPSGRHEDPHHRGCPDRDTDHDGVRDSGDECRTEPEGAHPDPERMGCPLPDRDHDTVPDVADDCPDQPGAPSRARGRNGCPGLVRIENGMLRILQPVFFANNRDTVLARSNRVLSAVVEALQASPEIQHVSIEGHTDDAGDDARNLDLSQRRAASVMAWLVRHGIAAERLEAHGFGETHPIAPNTDAGGRAQNRRVEFRIVDPNAASASPTPQ